MIEWKKGDGYIWVRLKGGRGFLVMDASKTTLTKDWGKCDFKIGTYLIYFLKDSKL